MGPQAVREYAAKMRRRYGRATRAERGNLLDEFEAVTGRHRKYAIALLGGKPKSSARRRGRPSRFPDAAVAALATLWRAMDYPWSVRLQAMLPLWLAHAGATFALDQATKGLILGMSPSTIDRLLRPHRSALRRRFYGRTKPGTLLKHNIPIRSERWDTSEAGWCEIDTVAHCGPTGEGEFASSVNVTDVATTWTETRAVLGKGQRHVVAALESVRIALPFAMRGIDSDSGSEFINRQCVKWCQEKGLDFTRSRPYHKNDNAYVEQKNWTHVRKVFGWKRFDSHDAVQAMNDLYENEVRLLMNYFQTSVKLIEKRRIGSRVQRRYGLPLAPLDRCIALGVIDPATAERLVAHRRSLDPFALAASIERKIAVITALPDSPAPRAKPIGAHAPSYSKKAALAARAFEDAPVRSFLTR